MLASHGMRTSVLLAAVAVLLAAVTLSACSESPYQPPSGDSLPAYTARDAQVSPAARTAIADLIGDLAGPGRS